jgi:hypothetical protein
MNNLRGKVNQPVLIGALAFIAGLIIGLVVLGWFLWPVQWKDAPINLLRPDIQEDMMMWAINSYDENPDVDLAKKLISDLGESHARDLFAKVQVDYKGKLNADGVKKFEELLKPPADATGTKTPAPSSGPINLPVVFILMCLLTLVIGGILVYLFFFRSRNANQAAAAGGETTQRAAPAQAYVESGQEPPVVQYLTTYSVGNDLYDDSFSIDSPTGEFLGECGVGISETIGVGDPKKVTAFEVWLFDKNDIQTVTKVLMSAHAFNDPVIMQRLTSKGEPVLAEPGKRVVLETATLSLEARVVSMNYGQGALPQSSFFDQMTLELAVWPKKA